MTANCSSETKEAKKEMVYNISYAKRKKNCLLQILNMTKVYFRNTGNTFLGSRR